MDTDDLVMVRALAGKYPTPEAARAAISRLKAALTLPKGTVHVISDIHGEFEKLKHVINNGSGSLRPLVEKVFKDRLSPGERLDLLHLIAYPRETCAHLLAKESAGGRVFFKRMIGLLFDLLREISRGYSLDAVESAFPESSKTLFRELLFEPQLARDGSYLDSLLEPFIEQGDETELLRQAAHVIRNLLISEIIVAGDMGDRGPRIDKVIDFLVRQPNVSITWGNHDASWMAACLGHAASIATVLRISLRYRRLSQLEEGYGIPMAPLEKLARTVYADDAADRFACKGEGLRDPLLMARMQKAIAVIQFKLESQIARRNPEFGLEDRDLLRRIDPKTGAVDIAGRTHPLLDSRFPTVDWADPDRLAPEEESCVERLRRSFLHSQVLWRQMRFVGQRGCLHLVRDRHLIFHGCVPAGPDGSFLGLTLDGTEYRGRALFEAMTAVVRRAFRKKDPADLDRLWYLWAGPVSPLFGKDKMSTFEGYFVADKQTHKETKNPYFQLIHEKDFCRRVLEEFGVDSREGLIVNGHVPVKVEKGESPLKKSGMAITIDGAFSEAYGDRGYTLILDAGGTRLAAHHHFESVEDAVTRGADIIPEVETIRAFGRPRAVGDTEAGADIRREISVLERLIRAFEERLIS